MKKVIKLLGLMLIGQQLVFAANPASFVVKPYLQWSNQTQMTVKWETSIPTQGFVEFGKAELGAKAPSLNQKAIGKSGDTFQTVNLTGLEAETEYFYRAVSVSKDGDTLRSSIYPFKTAVKQNSAFAFAVLSDTQGVPNPFMWSEIAKLAEKERPNFAIHSGDMVDNGSDKTNWVGQFFPQGQEFMSKYAIFGVSGNHDHYSPLYQQYLGHPDGLRVYSFVYGNTEFFMVDSNQDLAEGTDAYNKLVAALSKSTAKWKVVAHHHPVYSSDDDDYGNTRVAKSTLGSPKIAHLAALYEKYNVDLVFYGHIHTYERTWPIRENKVNLQNGVIYLTMGGGGGGLERPAPMRSWFTNKIFTNHHFGIVRIADGQLEFQAIDHEGHLFDQFTLKK